MTDDKPKTETVNTQSGTRLQKPSDVAMKEDTARKAARRILSCYPDYNKAPPEYIDNIIGLLAGYDEEICIRLSDLRTGIASRCVFLPTIADLVAMATELDLARRKRDFDRYAHLRDRVVLSMDDYARIRKIKR
jgi:hypothetical protein